MPIRMEKDESNQSQNPRRSGGSGNALLRFLPLILMFLFKRPKLLVPVLLIGAAWYFLFGGKEMLSGGGGFDANDQNFMFGATLSEEQYDKAEVFEPLAYGSFNQIPSRVSLSSNAPRPLHQGRQGSCVGWASAYAARTILHSKATGQDPNRVAFSPAYLYNQIALEGCQGAYMLDAMRAMRQNGAVPFSEFGYTDRSCSNQPSGSDVNLGQQFRIKGYNRLTMGGNNYKPDIQAIKQNLAQGAPVVIGMQVGGSFMSRMLGQKVWRPSQSDYSMRGFSGHAMCVIGYDDNVDGGAFEIQNSWGEDWGARGIGWVRYSDFEYFVKEAYGLYPMGSADKFDQNKLAVEFGLLDLASKNTITLQGIGDGLFRTVAPINKGDKFKVLIANSVECYIYVFGQETDGSSYVLFPYTSKHSAYCGITGTRLFPKDYSMVADDLGSTDRIAIVISKKEMDFEQLNNLFNSNRQPSYYDTVRGVLAGEQIPNIRYQTGQTIAFETETKGKNVVGMVIEIDKR